MVRIIWLLIVLCNIGFLYQCNGHNEAEVEPANGAQLSKLYCQSCHKYALPESLDRETWQSIVLPRMGQMLGVYDNPKQKDSLVYHVSNLYPSEQIISNEEWHAIKEFYLKNAPIKLETKTFDIDTIDFKFTAHAPGVSFNPPSTTFVDFDETSIVMGDAHTKSFLIFDSQRNLKNAAKSQEGLVHYKRDSSHIWLTVMGSFSPKDDSTGFILKLPLNGAGYMSSPIEGLNRPVHALYEDFDKDGVQEVVVSEFGKWKGQLSMFVQSEEKYKKEVMHNQTGAISAHSIDLNKDGLKDMLVLFGQGNEGIWAFYNEGGLKFKMKEIMQFPPTYGSSSMSLIDYNNDGLQDILYCAGDNADYKPILKPYHGVYVFTNQSNGVFEEALFLPLNGAYGAVCHDFDNDGDKDIAAISFFPDYLNNPDEGFVLFEQSQPNVFKRKGFANANLGRWIRMGADDFDQDGDIDLVLGSLAFEVVDDKMSRVEQWMKKGIPYIFLENELIQKK